MNVHLDDAIYSLQRNGGITRMWQQLTPLLRDNTRGITFDPAQPADVFISTYYRSPSNGERSVVVVYDFIAERYKPIGAANLDAMRKREAIKSADHVIAISKWTAHDCQAIMGRAANVMHLGVGEQCVRALPDEVAAFRERYAIDRPYVLLVGRRDLYKNAHALYQAWALWGSASDHMVLCIGGETETPHDRAFRQQHNWQRIEPDDADLYAAYSGATALVYPSLYEGFGLPVLEAMACGCPVVCGDGGALPEVTGDAAVLCDPIRPVTIAAALDRALTPATRFEHIQAGYVQAKAFTWRQSATKLLDILERLQ